MSVSTVLHTYNTHSRVDSIPHQKIKPYLANSQSRNSELIPSILQYSSLIFVHTAVLSHLQFLDIILASFYPRFMTNTSTLCSFLVEGWMRIWETFLSSCFSGQSLMRAKRTSQVSDQFQMFVPCSQCLNINEKCIVHTVIYTCQKYRFSSLTVSSFFRQQKQNVRGAICTLNWMPPFTGHASETAWIPISTFSVQHGVRAVCLRLCSHRVQTRDTQMSHEHAALEFLGSTRWKWWSIDV